MIKIVFSIIIIAALAVGWMTYQKSEVRKEIHTEASEIVKTMVSYNLDSTYLDQLFEDNFEQAFSTAYKKGEVSKGESLNKTLFFTVLFDQMIAQAEADEKTIILAELKIKKLFQSGAK